MLRHKNPADLLRERRLQRDARSSSLHQPLQRTTDAHALSASAESSLSLRGAHALVGPGRFAGAAMAWMSATFLLCYLALPLGRVAMGLSAQSGVAVLGTALASAAGLLGVLALLGTLLAVVRPAIQVDVEPDRILAATSGSLLVWGLLHNVLPGLMFFSEMTGGELGSFVASNFLESALFGVVLASVARTGRGAFALGAVFQTLLFSLSYIAMGTMFLVGL